MKRHNGRQCPVSRIIVPTYMNRISELTYTADLYSTLVSLPLSFLLLFHMFFNWAMLFTSLLYIWISAWMDYWTQSNYISVQNCSNFSFQNFNSMLYHGEKYRNKHFKYFGNSDTKCHSIFFLIMKISSTITHHHFGTIIIWSNKVYHRITCYIQLLLL